MILLRNLRDGLLLRSVYHQKHIFNSNKIKLRMVQTTKKSSDTLPMDTEIPGTQPYYEKKGYSPASATPRPWKSLGFDYVDETVDYMWAHSYAFFINCVLLGGLFFCGLYYPDAMEDNWNQREAYIQIRRREVLGLPLVDKNYVDPSTVNLPPDEELGDDDIVI